MTLKEFIIEKIGSVATLASIMGMTPQNLYRKIRQPETMSIADVRDMAKVLGTTSEHILKLCSPN